MTAGGCDVVAFIGWLVGLVTYECAYLFHPDAAEIEMPRKVLPGDTHTTQQCGWSCAAVVL